MSALVANARPLLAQACRNRAAALRPSRARLAFPMVRAYKGEGEQEENKELTHQKRPETSVYRPDTGVMRLGNIFNEMQREMDLLTRSFFNDDFMMMPFRSPGAMRDITRQMDMPMRLATDVHEDDKAFVVKADVPGMSKEDIKIKLHEGSLLISGERKSEKKEGEGENAWVERSFGSFMRSFRLPPNVDPNAISAACKDGVLTVTIPKAEVEEPKAKEIPVE